MMDSRQFDEDAKHLILHAWVATYLRGASPSGRLTAERRVRIEHHAAALAQSAADLAAALEKMRVANAKLALRMAEHKAFFAKYRPNA